MNYFIDVVVQEARLLHLNINLFIEKKERKKKIRSTLKIKLRCGHLIKTKLCRGGGALVGP